MFSAKRLGSAFFYQQYLLSESDILPNFYITSSTVQNELSPTRQKDVIPTKGCSNCAKLEQELATYKNEYFPFMLLVKNLMFGYFEEPIPSMELER